MAVIPSLEEKAQLKGKAMLRKFGAIFAIPTSPRIVQRDNIALLHLMSTASVTAYVGYSSTLLAASVNEMQI